MLSNEELQRYSRHIVLEGVGEAGQNALKEAKVLVIGAGGLGSPVAMYLAAAGVGCIGLADADAVDVSNLQRQVLYTTANVGKPKVEMAKERIVEQNPYVNVITYPMRIMPDNICDIVKEYDFIVDCVDNFPTKFLINDACVLEKKPFCHAGVVQFHGQVMTYVPGQGPCYRCIFEEIPPQGSVATCSEAGVLGAMVGIIGSLQALEVLKYFTDAGELLTGKLLTVDGLTMNMRKVNFSKAREDCPVCGKHPTIQSTEASDDRYMEKEVCTLK